MKTAMQELIDDLKSVESEDFIKYGIIKRAEYYLEKEKEQIIQAVNNNEKKAVEFCNEAVFDYWNHEGLFDVDPDAGINYFNKTFTDNE